MLLRWSVIYIFRRISDFLMRAIFNGTYQSFSPTYIFNGEFTKCLNMYILSGTPSPEIWPIFRPQSVNNKYTIVNTFRYKSAVTLGLKKSTADNYLVNSTFNNIWYFVCISLSRLLAWWFPCALLWSTSSTGRSSCTATWTEYSQRSSRRIKMQELLLIF